MNTPSAYSRRPSPTLPATLIFAITLLSAGVSSLRAGDRPFHAAWEGPLFGNIFSWSSAGGYGENMHLGRSMVDFSFFSFSPVHTRMHEPMTLTSSNGDAIWASVEATFEPDESLVFGGTFTGTITINGGSGRFESATGSASMSLSVEFFDWFGGYALTLDGSIDY